MKRIGLLGGTFNPIHKGHLKIARLARKTFKLQYILFIPTALPPHKSKKDLAPSHHRFRMVQLALQNHPYFKISRIEMDSHHASFAVDTLRKLKKRYGATTELYYIMGIDQALEIATWKSPKKLAQLAHLVIVDRPDRPRPNALPNALKTLFTRSMDQIHFLSAAIPISSTRIRKTLQQGKTVTSFLPKNVVAYLNRHLVYHPKPPRKN